MSRTVTTIPASRPVNGPAQPEQTKRKVAAYARVSTDSEEQQTSYEAQVSYYREYIKSQPAWEYVDVYTDEGISGTSTKKREGFKRMVKDALAGKIDLIITKSVSRFARNTVDSLSNIRKLKSAGVEVYFEKENIYTFDGKGEVMLTIMASLAQEESRSISENTTWGQRKRFADGKASVAFSNFLGYDRGENGEFVVNPEQAEVVKEIYYLFLQGKTYRGIARYLTEKGCKTPSGKSSWGSATVKSILTNEKYRGDALLQKSYVADYLTKKMKKNNGEIPQYYVENNHEAIIAPEVFAQVQEEVARRGSMAVKGTQKTFTAKLKCADCGHWYGPKTWHSTNRYKKIVWFCNHKYRAEKKCETPTLNEEEIQKAFIAAANQLLARRDEITGALQRSIDTTLNTRDLLLEKETLETEYDRLSSKGRELLKNKGKNFYREFEEIENSCQEKQKRIESLENEISARDAKKARLSSYINQLNSRDILEEFDEDLFAGTVIEAEVYASREICFKFIDGSEIRVTA